MSTDNDQPKRRMLRLRQIIAPDGPLPIAASTWWLGVKTGRYPKGVKLGPRITAWPEEQIDEVAKGGGK